MSCHCLKTSYIELKSAPLWPCPVSSPLPHMAAWEASNSFPIREPLFALRSSIVFSTHLLWFLKRLPRWLGFPLLTVPWERRGQGRSNHWPLSLSAADGIERELAQNGIGENWIELIRRPGQNKSTKIGSFLRYQLEPVENAKEIKERLCHTFNKAELSYLETNLRTCRPFGRYWSA